MGTGAIRLATARASEQRLLISPCPRSVSELPRGTVGQIPTVISHADPRDSAVPATVYMSLTAPMSMVWVNDLYSRPSRRQGMKTRGNTRKNGPLKRSPPTRSFSFPFNGTKKCPLIRDLWR